MQGTTTTSVFKLWLCLGALQGHSLAGRAERQLDRVADFGQRLGKPAAEGDIDDGDLEIRYDLPRSGPELALSRPTQRPPAGQWSRLAPREPLHWTKRSPDGSALVYVVAPVSQRIIPLDGDKVAQGFRSFVPLADSYQLGLQRQLPAAAARSTALVGPTGGLADQCRMARASVELTRDEVDKISGKLLRNCRGWVQLNRCEGSCGSSSEPSIRSLTGFRKVSCPRQTEPLSLPAPSAPSC